MKKKWQDTPLAAKIGFFLEVMALVLFLVFMVQGMRVPYLVLNIFLIGAVLVGFGTYGRHNRRK